MLSLHHSSEQQIDWLIFWQRKLQFNSQMWCRNVWSRRIHTKINKFAELNRSKSECWVRPTSESSPRRQIRRAAWRYWDRPNEAQPNWDTERDGKLQSWFIFSTSSSFPFVLHIDEFLVLALVLFFFLFLLSLSLKKKKKNRRGWKGNVHRVSQVRRVDPNPMHFNAG